MTIIRFASVIMASGLILTGCGSPAPQSENSVQTQSSKAASSDNALAIEQATRSPGTPAPQAREPSPEFAALPEPYSQASYSVGKRVFKLCSSCHTVKENGPNVLGPNLHGIFGSQIGSAEGFPYSEALENADFIWTPEKLDAWLESPRTFLPDNRMTFQGIRKPAERNAIIAYLMVESGWEPAE